MAVSVVVDIAEFRNRRALEKSEALRRFGRLPCPRCDSETEAEELVQGGARFVCRADRHAVVEWTYDGDGGVVIDGRRRRYIAF